MLAEAGSAGPGPEAWPWPSTTHVPHNEGGNRVGPAFFELLEDSSDLLAATPFMDLSSLVEQTARWQEHSGVMRLLLGRGHALEERRFAARTPSPSQWVREAVAKRPLDIHRASATLVTLDLVRAGRLVVRVLVSSDRRLDARAAVSSAGAWVGSSPLTESGLGRDAHANILLRTSDDPEHVSALEALLEGLWQLGADWTQEFAELLEQSLQPVSWQEALASACAITLEGDWVGDRRGERPAGWWPHQEVGLAHARAILEQQGGVIIADATGSGKTRLGAQVITDAMERERMLGERGARRPVLISPPGVSDSWRTELRSRGAPTIEAYSHGTLSAGNARLRPELMADLSEARFLAIDEAHNFINDSNRTRGALTHFAEEVVLLTATPINRGAQDLVGLVALLGVDNLTDAHIEIVQRLQEWRPSRVRPVDDGELNSLGLALQAFMVRRSRQDINAFVSRWPEGYSRVAGPPGFPRRSRAFFELPLSERDDGLLRELVKLAESLSGVGRIGEKLSLPLAWRRQGLSEQRALELRVHSAQALARYFALKTLRSSRAALIEHILGTDEALKRLALEGLSVPKDSTNGAIARLQEISGEPPRWAFKDLDQAAAPEWLRERGAHRRACEEEIVRYERIAELAALMSEDRLQRKQQLLLERQSEGVATLAFDGHLITLALLAQRLKESGAEHVSLLTGKGGGGQKRIAEDRFHPDRTQRGALGLLTDAFSEGLNLQGASCVVHLDSPTVIRTVVQRAGRVDRLNSRHAQVTVYWPREPELLQPRRKDLLRRRVEVEDTLIGTHISLPAEDGDARMSIERVADHADAAMEGEAGDAFTPVEALVQGENALVPQWLYDRVRGAPGAPRCCLALLPVDTRSWAFFLLQRDKESPPRWVLLGPGGAPAETRLRLVTEALREELHPGLMSLDIRGSGELIERALRRLEAGQRQLLSLRRRRALELLEDCLGHLVEAAWRQAPGALGKLSPLLRALRADTRLDLSALAERWLSLLRPRWRDHLAERRGRTLPRLQDLREGLEQAPPSVDELVRLFDGLPLLPPIGERVRVAIIAGPSPDQSPKT